MEDLDSLLEDLGRGKSASTVKKQRPPSSRVDLNELEDLMEELAVPTATKTPEVTPAIKPAQVSVVQTTTATPTSKPNTTTNGRPASTTQNSTPAPAPKPVTPAPQPAPQSTPSTGGAVDDLDALMESLNATSSRSRRSVKPATTTPSTTSEPAPAQPKPTPAYEPPAPAPAQTKPANRQSATKDDLDSLLSNLTKEMDKIDTDNPLSRGTCGTCKAPILGEMIQALGKTYHPEHFACGNCRTPLGTKSFYEANGSPHCENCYQELFCPKCGHCDRPVLDRCITALGKKWHVDHFICTVCLKPFANGAFFEKDGRPYCEADFFGKFAPKCASCNEPIRGDCINALGSQWHPEHFACAYCQKAFSGGSFFEYGGKPYCETHYHQQTGSLCSGCGKPITGRCVNALDKKWHPEHFVCAFCMNTLAGGSFTEHNNKPYCKECHGKLFGA